VICSPAYIEADIGDPLVKGQSIIPISKLFQKNTVLSAA
jgi:hypothetical protein